MEPEDLALLHQAFPNVVAVKEATGVAAKAVKIRQLCGDTMAILSGDDERTYGLMRDSEINANGAISVIANIIPGPLQQLTEDLRQGQHQKAAALEASIRPLLELVQVETQEAGPWGAVRYKARNPLPLKTLMGILGMPAGPCRRPLGRMTRTGVQVMLEAALAVQRNDPSVFEPIACFFEVDIERRLTDIALAEKWCYEQYEGMESMGV